MSEEEKKGEDRKEERVGVDRPGSDGQGWEMREERRRIEGRRGGRGGEVQGQGLTWKAES